MAIRSFDKLLRLALASAVFASLGALSAGCGGSEEPARTPAPAPAVTLSTAERELWRPLPPDRSGIPVLVYHGIGPPSDFSNSSDAEYGVDEQAFAKQMTFLTMPATRRWAGPVRRLRRRVRRCGCRRGPCC